MSFVARAAMAVALLVGVYVLAVGLVGVLGFAVYEGFAHGFGGVLLGKGLVLVVLLALGLARAFWAARRLGGGDPGGLLIEPQDQPQLWDEVRGIAETIGTRAPDEIRLVPMVNAWVREDSRFLGLVGGRRVLAIGAPLVMGLTRQQLRGVLAHELGHFSHRHTALASVAYRGQVTLGQIVGRLGHDTVTGKIFAAYGWLYLRLTRTVSRRQELEADRWSGRLAGPAASAGALREIPALDAIWGHFLEEYAFRVEGVRPEDLFAGFGNLLASPQRQTELDEVRSALPEEPASPYDTHPSLAVRIAFFESLPEDGTADDPTPAVRLFDDADAVLNRLETEMFARTDLEPRPWEWIAETAGLRRAREHASLLVRATREGGSGAADLRQAIVALGRGENRRLVRPYVPLDAPPDDVRAAARALVRAAVSAALVEHCAARFTIDWDATTTLVGPEGHPIDVAGLVDGTTDRESATQLIQALEQEGVPMTFSVDPAVVDAGDGAPARTREPVVQAVAACVHWRRMRVLVVSESAFIVKRLGLLEGLAAAFRQGTTDGYRNSMRHVASIPLPQLLDDPRAEVFPWDRVGPVVVSGKRFALTLDGRTRRVRVKSYATLGDLLGSLKEHLGDRLVVR